MEQASCESAVRRRAVVIQEWVVRLALVLLLVSVTGPAHAAFYVGASYLQTDSELDTVVNDFEADDESFKVFGGFNFVSWLGVEASYRDLGSHSDTIGATAIDVDLEAIDVGARGMLSLGKLISLFAKAGLAQISSDGSFSAGSLTTNVDDDDWELLYGVGVDVHILRRLGVRAEWEEYDVEDSLSSFSAGAFFRF